MFLYKLHTQISDYYMYLHHTTHTTHHHTTTLYVGLPPAARVSSAGRGQSAAQRRLGSADYRSIHRKQARNTTEGFGLIYTY